MSLALGFCIFAFTGAAVLYVGDWLEDGGKNRRGVRGLPSLRTGASLFVSLGFLCYHQYTEAKNSLPELALQFPPYPDAAVVDQSHFDMAGGVSIWTLETQDSPQAVIAFYDKIAPEEHLKLTKSYRTNPWSLFISKDDLEVTINIKDTPGGTSIKYFLRRIEARPPASPSG